jgi:DNA uptake protein ComE-like DNA-binding protein
MEKNIIKNRPHPKRMLSSLTEKEKQILHHVKIYTQRIYNLSTKIDMAKEDMQELETYNDIDQYKANKIAESLKKNYLATMKQLKKFIVGKKNYKEVINSFA